MARPVKRRRICGLPPTAEFIPRPRLNAELVSLTLDEYEAIRLIDDLGLTQEDCAGQMNVSRTTVQAIYDAARRKLADALVHGKRLKIQGGCYDVCPHARQCCGRDCGRPGCAGRCCADGAPDGRGCPWGGPGKKVEDL